MGPAGAQCSDDSTEARNRNFEAKFPELLNFGLKKNFFFFFGTVQTISAGSIQLQRYP